MTAPNCDDCAHSEMHYIATRGRHRQRCMIAETLYGKGRDAIFERDEMPEPQRKDRKCGPHGLNFKARTE